MIDREKVIDLQPLISVVICTRNREILLLDALESLIMQNYLKSNYEIVIVDNSTNNQTARLIESFRVKNADYKIIYLKELRQGLSISRNTGYKQSKGKYIAFLDDDSKADKHWLGRINNYFSKLPSSVMAIGGSIIPFYKTVKPIWFKDEYESDIKGDKPRFLKRNESFSGSNMIWRRECLTEFGGFIENLGMSGDVISVGEETYLFEKIWEKSKNNDIFFYYPDLIIYHLVPEIKMNSKYRLLRWFAYGQSLYFRTKSQKWYKKLWQIIKILGYFTLSILLAIVLLIRYRHFENWIVEKVGPLMYCLGYLLSFIGLKIQPKANT